MKILVTYKSKTEFTKRYAEIIAKEVNGKLMDFKEVTPDKGTSKQFILFATGGTPNEATEQIDEVWRNNLSAEELESIPHFYMQGGICYEKMSFPNRAIMKMMSKVLSKKKNKDSAEEGFAQAIKSSYDISSKEYAEPLIKHLLEE